jgi:hypothetical protein
VLKEENTTKALIGTRSEFRKRKVTLLPGDMARLLKTHAMPMESKAQGVKP